MKFPSVKTLAEGAANTIKRFPFEVLFALAGTIAATVRIELRDISPANENWCYRTMMVANLGFLLSLSVTLYAESRALTTNTRLLFRFGAAVIAVGFIFLLNPGERQADYIRFTLLSLSFHLLIAFAAFTAPGHVQGFWQFNKTLFLRILTAVLYSIALALGISAAIAATNYLFNFKFEWDTYTILWTWIIGMFSSVFFLAGVPADFNALDEDLNYPKGLKIFTQYVLIPLATVYVLILLAYETKILVEWNLPKGVVSYLILSYSVFGILSLLLVYPIREQEENKWLKTYTRSFYFLLIPLLVLLFLAVGARVNKYGVTEYRYFLILLTCWLAFITAYFLLFKQQNIKLIPISLCVLTLLTIYGPQSGFSIARYSQQQILVKHFKKYDAYKNGKLISLKGKKIKGIDGSRTVATLDYLIEHYDFNSLQPYFNTDLGKVNDSLSIKKSKWNTGFIVSRYELRDKKLTWVKKQLGLTKYTGYIYNDTIANVSVINEDAQRFYFNNEDGLVNVKGFDYILNLNIYGSDVASTVKEKGMVIKQSNKLQETYNLWINDELFSFDATAIAKELIANKKIAVADTSTNADDVDRPSLNYTIPAQYLTVTKESKTYIVTLVLSGFGFSYDVDKAIVPTQVTGTYLLKKKIDNK
ncbi:hypothetical protein GCM10023149_34570 [Mucilaginibacter gynuensis]|uniref:DUF4153 domain-containing protein n=1 Tax=Mucilaginibacter gynuensis TaxID=1302236 RepID=A0ABP8GTS8_9SPHI